MTDNPFAAKASTATAAPEVKTEEKASAKAGVQSSLGAGDPFAAPKGIGDGEAITGFVGRLLLVKPTEIIEEMNTKQGKTKNVVRADLAVLDDPEEPGKVVEGVLLFQQALKREAANIYYGPLPYLLGRLEKGTTGGGNTLYTFETATEEEADLARQFLKVKTL